MSPSPNQFPQSSPSSDQAQTSEQVIRRPNPPKPPVNPPAATAATPKVSNTQPAKAPATAAATSAPTPVASDPDPTGEVNSANQDFDRRQQPIPPPSEPMQYRAIGLVRGKYVPSAEQFTRGMLLTTDEKIIDSVLLGRVMSLVKNHLDLNTDHLWVVYPRTRQEDGDLHLQIVGVWEPEKLDKSSTSGEESETEPAETSHSEPIPVTDGYFSVRGEVVYQAQDQQKIIIKIRQAPRKDGEKPKFFKLTLNGTLEKKAVGYFWEFHSQREAQALLIKESKQISLIRPKKNPFPKRTPGGGGKKPWKQQRPIRPGVPPGSSPSPRSTPIPRPMKRQQPSSES